VKRSYVLVLIIAMAVFGAIGAVNATKTVGMQTDVRNDVQEPNYVTSIKDPQTNDETREPEEAKEDDEAQEAKALEDYVKVTPEDAKNAALAKVPGKVVKVSLDNENGYVVYSVEISTNNGIKDVKVDAGNGQVIYVDSDHESEQETTAEHETTPE
jgi:uncharacterized membrane protein YkoI